MAGPSERDPEHPERADGWSVQPLGPGTTVNGRYLIERELGRGGIGVVYLARDHRLHDMPVVIKFLLDDSTEHPWLSRKFLQEAEALTRINHPGVVRVIDRDRTPDGRPFFVMEFVKGASLRTAIRPSGLDLEFAAAVVREIGQALSAAHREGVLHRDLKPENIMLETLSDGEQHAKLIDFGIAKVRDSREGSTTEMGSLAGSLHYMAPEQLLGEPASAASDIYALATVAYELLTGRRPFNPDAPNQIVAIQQLMSLQRSEHIVLPQQLRPGVPPAAQAVVMRGLAFDPTTRPADARQFAEELSRALLGGDPVEPTLPVPATGAPMASASDRALLPDDAPAVSAAAVDLPSRAGPSLRESPPSTQKRRRFVALAVTGTFAVALGLASLATTWRSSDALPAFEDKTTPGPSPVPEMRTLMYSVTLQRDPRRFPDGKSIQLAGEAVFTAGDRVRLAFTSPQGGHLYIFNESPPLAGGPRSVNVLFPSPTSNNGSAELATSQTVTIPGRGDGFVFDEEEGVEKLWIVWSASAQPRLDGLKRWANPQDRGEIKDTADVDVLDAFLREHASPAPDAAVDEVARVTRLTARTDAFVRLITLEHH